MAKDKNKPAETPKHTEAQKKKQQQEKEKQKAIKQLAARQRKILRLRLAGHSLASIARHVGLSAKQTAKELNQELDALRSDQPLQDRTERMLELQRLDVALAALSEQVKQGELPAIDRWLRLCESRRKLLGLNRPPSKNDPKKKASSANSKTYINLDLDKV